MSLGRNAAPPRRAVTALTLALHRSVKPGVCRQLHLHPRARGLGPIGLAGCACASTPPPAAAPATALLPSAHAASDIEYVGRQEI